MNPLQLKRRNIRNRHPKLLKPRQNLLNPLRPTLQLILRRRQPQPTLSSLLLQLTIPLKIIHRQLPKIPVRPIRQNRREIDITMHHLPRQPQLLLPTHTPSQPPQQRHRKLQMPRLIKRNMTKRIIIRRQIPIRLLTHHTKNRLSTHLSKKETRKDLPNRILRERLLIRSPIPMSIFIQRPHIPQRMLLELIRSLKPPRKTRTQPVNTTFTDRIMPTLILSYTREHIRYRILQLSLGRLHNRTPKSTNTRPLKQRQLTQPIRLPHLLLRREITPIQTRIINLHRIPVLLKRKIIDFQEVVVFFFFPVAWEEVGLIVCRGWSRLDVMVCCI